MNIIAVLVSGIMRGSLFVMEWIARHLFAIILVTPLVIQMHFLLALPTSSVLSAAFLVSVVGYVAFLIGKGHLQRWAAGGLYLAGVLMFLAGLI